MARSIEHLERNYNHEILGRIEPTLVLLSGASAVGKTTMADYACEILESFGLRICKPVPYTTRPMRPGEVNGKDYHFVTAEEFEAKFRPKIEMEAEDWDVGQILGNWYFNRISETVPGQDSIVSLLPVSVDAAAEMYQLYRDRFPNLRVRLIHFKVGEQKIEEWVSRLQAKRPNRSVEKELSLNERIEGLIDDLAKVFEPEWNLEQDVIKFVECLLSAIID